MQTIKANYDITASAATAGVLLIVHAPWPFWAVWGVVVAYQLGNRIVNGVGTVSALWGDTARPCP